MEEAKHVTSSISKAKRDVGILLWRCPHRISWDFSWAQVRGALAREISSKEGRAQRDVHCQEEATPPC